MNILKISVVVGAALVSALFAGCGSGSSSSDGLIVSGWVYDISTPSSVPAAGVTVTLRRADDNSALATATTGGDGSFVISGAPAETDMYLNTSALNHASFNDEIINTAINVQGRGLWTAQASNVLYTVNLIIGNVGTTASWGDPYYAGKGWFTMDIFDSAGAEVPGISVTASPSTPAILYNNGSNVFSPIGPTKTLTASVLTVLVGGYSDTPGIYTFTLSDAITSRSGRLPLVNGEMTYIAVRSW